MGRVSLPPGCRVEVVEGAVHSLAVEVHSLAEGVVHSLAVEEVHNLAEGVVHSLAEEAEGDAVQSFLVVVLSNMRYSSLLLRSSGLSPSVNTGVANASNNN